MSEIEDGSGRPDESAAVAAAQAGDEAAFAGLVEPHRRELQVHCYRMLGSFEDSEDLVQETFLRAWRKCETFQGRSTFRAWLYRIATNACLDFLQRNPRQPRIRQAVPAGIPAAVLAPATEIAWLQPYPDRLLEPIAPSEAEPDAVVVAKETIELAFLAAVQHLPPQQRAVLILRDVLGWSGRETAALLELTVPAVKSALQRARPTMKQHLPQRRAEWSAAVDHSPQERAVLQRFMQASERADMTALAALVREDAWQTMPPQPVWFPGRAAMLEMWAQAMTGPESWGDWRLLPTSANRQPAAANYFRPRGESTYRASNLDVLRIEDGLVAEVTTFGPELFPAFGLPPTL
ncbi:MAG: sigma-70 family RNA polymerase sigma factor [Jiangellaceae bacterium]